MTRNSDNGMAQRHTKLVKHDKRVRAMIEDPECHGDLLLIGLALARMIDLDGVRKGQIEWESIVRGYMSPPRGGDVWWRLNKALRDDIRRYQPPLDDPDDQGCPAPMVRRETCGRPGHHFRMFVDRDTGERYRVHSCSQRDHRSYLDRLWKENHADFLAEGAPEPVANRGGVLRRHIPEIKWEQIWRHYRSDWSPPPESPDEQNRPKPTLTLIIGGSE